MADPNTQEDNYPLGNNAYVPVGVDLERYHRYFNAESQRVFAKEGNRLSIVRVLSGSGRIESLLVEDVVVLQEEIAINKSPSTQDTFYLIFQQSSWGRFCVSLRAFKILLASHRIFVPFLDFVQAYGFKTHADLRSWSGYRSKTSRAEADAEGSDIHEFCYNLQYVDLNGRNRGDPWSLRQCGIYQQICLKSRRSSWVLLQISDSMRAQLDRILQNKSQVNDEPRNNAMVPHIIFISAMAANWQRYLEHLQMQLSELDEKACFSRIQGKDSNSFPVSLQDSQDLQLLRQKLLRTSTVLVSCLEVLKGCRFHYRKLVTLKLIDEEERISAELEVYIKQIQRHSIEIKRLLEYSLGTSQLLFKILDIRENTNMREVIQSTRRDLERLQRTASQIHGENSRFTGLAQQGHKDSRMLKILSVVATLYLPASLIATLFSSSLVQSRLNDVNDAAKGTHLAISPQFWVFVLSSVCLAAATIIYPLWRNLR